MNGARACQSWCSDFHYCAEADVLAEYEGYHASYRVHNTSDVHFHPENSEMIRLTDGIADSVVEVIEEGWKDPLAAQEEELTQEEVAKKLAWPESCIQHINKPFHPAKTPLS